MHLCPYDIDCRPEKNALPTQMNNFLIQSILRKVIYESLLIIKIETVAKSRFILFLSLYFEQFSFHESNALN